MSKRKIDNDIKDDCQQLHAVPNETKVVFSSDYVSNDLRLIELPKEIQALISNGESLEIKGNFNGKDVVLCTNKTTWDMKKVENSNSLFLVPGSIQHDIFHISAQISSIYELTLTNSRLNQIKDILKPTEYSIDNDHQLSLMMNSSNKFDAFDKQELYSQVQASSFEISNSLNELGVVDINNKVKLIAPAKYRETVRYLLDTILENSWTLDNISEKNILKHAPHIDILLLQLVLGKLGCRLQNNDDIWVLEYDKVAKASAHDLFITYTMDSPNKLWSCDEFVMAWSARTPSNNIPSADLLKGIALTEDVKKGTSSSNALSKSSNNPKQQYRYFPKENLSFDAKIRFRELFDINPSYTIETIAPYLDDLYGSPGQPQSLAALLLHYCKNIDNKYSLK